MAEKLTDEELISLVARYPLPEGVEDVVMTREILADAMAVAVPTISDWISKGMPVRTMGGIGRAYELQLSHCWAWRQAQKAEQDFQSEKMRRSVAAMRLALIGGGMGDSMEALDPKTRRSILEVQMMHEQFARHRNELLRRSDVEQTFETLFGLINQGLTHGPDKIDTRHALPPGVVDALIEVCDGILDSVRKLIFDFFADRPVRQEHEAPKTLFDQ